MKARVLDIGEFDRLSDALDYFRCCKDKDIENFLRKKAFQFLEKGWCSIYLILNEQKFESGKIKIEAYFTLSHKALILSEDTPKSRIKKITNGLKNIKSIHFVLIGQLGKYIELSENAELRSSSITSTEILNYAFEIIRASNHLIPCRFVLVECSENEKVQNVYIHYGFRQFQFDGEHYQLYKQL